MRTFAELGHVHRNQPCIEYPGEWLVYVDGGDETSHVSFEAAYQHGLLVVEDDWYSADESVSICWKCSDNDPRVGKAWFTGFYQHGKFNQFGVYKS
jgi:hypothetical protein